MADTLTYAYAADITKAERDENGDLIVYGKAAGPDLDDDDQICDPAWLKRAMPGWAEWSNIREMHQPICAGVGLETAEQGDDWWVRSKVLDDRTATKIEDGGLRGYSVGIKNPRVVRDSAAPGGRIVAGDIVEISYVDRPCNPTAKMAICKAVGMSPALEPIEAEDAETKAVPTPKDLAKSLNKTTEPAEGTTEQVPEPRDAADAAESGDGEQETDTVKAEGVSAGVDTDELAKQIVAQLQKGAMPPLKEGGPERYPIETVADLKDAIQSFGRGKDADKAKIKAHIKAEAKRLGRTDLIPDNWKALFADTTKAEGDAGGEPTHNPDELKAILTGLVNCMKAELDELLAGEDELFDVRCLLETVAGFCRWWFREAMGGETDSPFGDGSPLAYVELAATPDTTKADETTVESDTTKAADAADKTSEPGSDDLAELVKSAVADATKALTEAAEERNKALAAELDTVKADLAKALALPEPGGPVLTRTATQEAMARKGDAARLEAEANDLLRKAAQATDPWLAQGYRERAKEALEKAAA